MSSETFDFTQLKNVYTDALNSPDKSLLFEVSIGKGNFLFMMFLSDEDKDAKDKLFVYMRNTDVIVQTKLYGSHKKGHFVMYITDDIRNKFYRELQLNAHNGSFDFMRFLGELNRLIPMKIDRSQKVDVLRKNRKVITRIGVIDEAEKDVLIGPKYVSNGRPQERTLRKLYSFTYADYQDIDELIKLLKLQNKTVAWTTQENAKNSANILKLISDVKQQSQ